MTRITVLGLGRMGRELATHIVNAGHAVIVWNRTASSTEGLVALGATSASSPAAAIGDADLVVTVLFGPDTIQEIVVDSGLLPPGTVWLDVTTVSPADAARYEEWARSRGIHYAHAPVVGSLAPARAKMLGTYLGGDPSAVEAARPIVSLWTDPTRLVEVETPADAATGKLIANLALAISLQGLVEALRLGRANGLDIDTVIRMLGKTGLDFIATAKGDMVRSGSFDDTQFSVDLLAKDVRLMIASTPEPLPAATTLLETLLDAQHASLGDQDIAVVARPR